MVGTMLDVTIDRSDPTTLHEQVAIAIRRAIADGEVTPGDRLPAAKDFGVVLGVNTHTVLRAFTSCARRGFSNFSSSHTACKALIILNTL